MGLNDGAVLLTAILTSPTITEAPDRTKEALHLPFVGSVLAPIDRDDLGGGERLLGNIWASPLDAFPPFVLEDAIRSLLSTASLNVPSESGAYVESNEFFDFWKEDSVQITFGFPEPVAIVDTWLNKLVVRRHVFGGTSYFEANPRWRGFDLLDWEAKLSGQEFTQARRIGAKAFLATAASLMKPMKTTRVRR